MFKGPSASSTPTTISSTTSNRSLNRVHCSFSFDEKKKKKRKKRRRKKTKSFDFHSYRRTYSFNSPDTCIRARVHHPMQSSYPHVSSVSSVHPLATFAYMYTYTYTYTHIHIYIHTYTHTCIRTYKQTHKRPFSRCTRDIKSSNKKKEKRKKKYERKAKKRKRRKKRKGKGKRTRGAFSLVTFASARYFTSIFHRFID